MIVVQEIITDWLKRSRGAASSTAREQILDVLELPYLPGPIEGDAVVHHTVRFGDADEFEQAEHKVELKEFGQQRRLFFGCVRIYPAAEVLRVDYAYNMTCGGAPERTHFPRQVLSLSEGEWGRVVYNGRFSAGFEGLGDWLYRRRVVNVGYLNEPTLEPFGSGLAREFTDLAHLL